MKRPLLALLIAVVTLPMMAVTPRGIDTHAGKRIGVLRSDDTIDADVSIDIERELTKQLREAGFDAFDAQMTLRDLERDAGSSADLYVLVSGSEAADRQIGSVGVDAGNNVTTLGVSMSRVAAEVRVFDGKTLEVLERYDLSRSMKAIAPSSVGFGGRNFFVALAVPLVHHAQYRSAVRGVAAEATKRIAAR